MVCRLCLVASLILALSACQKDREDIESTTATSGQVISAASSGSGSGGGGGGGSSGSGGDGGAIATSTSGDPGSGGATTGGEGGDPTGGGAAPTTTGSGGGSTACGQEVECWGDDAPLCDFGICAEAFPECSPGEPSPFRIACGNLSVQFRSGVWAHFVDCLRAAGPDVGCTDGEAAVQACVDEASAQACVTAEMDAVCDGAELSCPGFDVAACRQELPLYVQEQFDYYGGCVEAGGDCATLHNVCMYGEANP